MNAVRTRRTKRLTASLGAAALATALIAVPSMAAIPPSTFDAMNGDVSTTTAGLTDWEDLTLDADDPANLESGEYRFKDDVPSGQGDDSFTQGTSENTEPPVPETGSVPPNKSDLTRFFIGTEKAGADDKPFLYLAWQRKLNPKGTTNMDFEFNQSEVLSTNTVTPVRTHGDVLIEYKLAKGGTVPEIFVYKWNDGSAAADPDFPGCEAGGFPCWSVRKNLTSVGAAEGSVNLGPGAISSTILKDGTADAFTFGEAAIDLLGAGLFTEGDCTTFGSAYLKSRSSDSFTAALKDYIAPMKIDLSNCGQFTIVKQTEDDTEGDFDFTVSPAAGSAAANGTGGAVTGGTLADGDSFTAYNVAPDTYDVTEDIPAGWNLDSVTCSDDDEEGDATTLIQDGVAITIAADSNVTCTFNNSEERGSILVEKVVADTTNRIAGASFAIDADGVITTPNDDLTVIPAFGDEVGLYCIDDLLFGSYTVVETSAPTGYSGAEGTQTFEVSSESTCGDRAADDVDLTFENKAQPSIVTQASGPVTVGATITDTATLSGGYDPTGTITFTAYSDDECTTLVHTDTEAVNGNGDYTTDTGYVTVAAGPIYWIASYSGDSSNEPAEGECGDDGETSAVDKAEPSIVTQASGPVTVGATITDTATLSGGYDPTGTITFTAYSDDECTTLVHTDTEAVNGNGDYTTDTGYVTTAAGTIYWIAEYSGDDNNEPASGECGDPGESSVVGPASPGIVTTPKLLPNDSALLSGGFGTLTGSISFELHDTADCSGEPIYEEGPIAVNGYGPYETNNEDVFITGDGTYSWYVSYSGDGNNNAAFSYCDAEQQVVDFTPLNDIAPQQVAGT